MKFLDYNKELVETQQKILMLSYLAQNQGLNEDLLEEGIKEWLQKAGLSIVKGPSIITYLDDFVSGVGTIVLAAMAGDKHKIKAQMDRFDASDLVDFLHTLDDITLGIISAPLDLIQGITGWNLKATVENGVKSAKRATTIIKSAIQTIRTNISKIAQGDNQKQLMLSIDSLDSNLPDSEIMVKVG